MASHTNINSELNVIYNPTKDYTKETGPFSFLDGYYGDAVRANVHEALLKIDDILGEVLYGGGEVELPDPFVTDLIIESDICGSAAVYCHPNTDAVVGLADMWVFVLVTDEEEPDDWDTNYSSYYSRDAETGELVARSSAGDEYVANTYYLLASLPISDEEDESE